MKNIRKKQGLTLVELIIATAVLSILILVLAASMLSTAKGLVKAREQARAQRLARIIHVQLESMNFRDIFSCDSSLPFFGLTSRSKGGLHSAPYKNVVDPFSFYPSSHTLLDMLAASQGAGFPRFDIGVTFLRRDRSAIRAVGVTSNLIPFTDTQKLYVSQPSVSNYTSGDGYDDFDPLIRYQDINGDGDYFDSYFLGKKSSIFEVTPSGCIDMPLTVVYDLMVIGCEDQSSLPYGSNFKFKSISEMPDTRLKQVTLRLWNRKGELVHHEGWVISEGGFSGNQIDDWESVLSLDVQQPVASMILFASSRTYQSNAQNLAIKESYPVSPPILQADSTHPMRISGHTAALADLIFSTNTRRIGNGMDLSNADQNGLFNFPAQNITAALREGENLFGGIARKNGFSSPLWQVSLIYDTRPPYFTNAKPANNSNPVKTLTPFLGIQLFDDTIATTAVSGIAREVIYVSTKVGNGGSFEKANFLYRDGWANYGKDWLVLASANSGLIEPFPDNSWVEVKVEGGDYAQYKTSSTWKIKINIDNHDSSSPTIKVPSLTTDGCSVVVTANVPLITCDLDDPDSGIDWHTIHLTVNPGSAPMAFPYIANVSLSTTPRMADYFNPTFIETGGRLTYQFPGPIPVGQYCLAVSVNNWKGIPSNLSPKVFNVP